MAVLYSPENEVDIRLSTSFDAETMAVLAEDGPEQTVALHFQTFEGMLQSIRGIPE
jgi:hypothetical protein